MNNNNFKQLELFQDSENYNQDFDNAKTAKEYLKKIYSNFEIEDKSNIRNFQVLNFRVDIDQLIKRNEPDTPKLFLRRYKPVLEIYSVDNLITPIKTLNLQEKTIPPFINEIYTGTDFPQDLFYELSKQYILLETVNDYISENYDLLNSNKSILIYISSKIFNLTKPKYSNPHMDSAINKINNISDKLKKLNNVLFIGVFFNYKYEDNLIFDLTNDAKINIPNDIQLKDYFHNDFLFLNNAEFISEKTNTNGWKDIIFSPNFLNNDSRKLILNSELPNEFYYYQKLKLDGIFYKIEIYKNNLDFNFKTITIIKELIERNERNKIRK